MANRLPYEKTIGGAIYVRLVIPPALQPFANNQKNIYRPIGATRQEAKRNHARALASAQDEMDAIKRRKAEAEGAQIMRVSRRYAEMTPDQMAREHYCSRLAFDDELRNDPRYAASPIDDELVEIVRDIKAGRGTDAEIAQALGGALARFRARGNTDAEPQTAKWREIARTVAFAEYEALSRVAERDEGDFSGKPEMPALLVDESDPVPAVPLMKLFDSYFLELAASGRGAEAKRRWKPVMEHLIKFLQHDDARRVTRADVLRWKDDLLTRLAPKTVRDSNLAALKAVLQWAKDNDRIADNPAADVKVRVTEKPQEREKGFTDAEAVAILTAVDAYQPKHSDNPQTREGAELTAAKRWMPWLSAFTGARPAELAQLRGQDVQERDGISFLRLTPAAGSVKSGQYRDVPLHPQLIERGFLEFAKAAGEGPLFFKIRTKKDASGARSITNPFTASKTVSGRVSEWLRTLPAMPSEMEPQYAWRHRFKTLGDDLDIKARVVDAIQGHAPRTAGETYGDVSLKARKAAIDRIPRIEIGNASQDNEK
ncbi:site-specific integrase [Aureimonas psammosilenae]|uniref:integrase n=1 Tax=Aureimonas psammosilenae TaxID=2495496 RepID=UPI0012609DE7|nr:integrase [Aureimonas psammosilenae]